MNPKLKIAAGVALGGLAGYAYYYFIGCSSGTCPITSNPNISVIYGAGIGALLTIGSKKKKNDANENKESTDK